MGRGRATGILFSISEFLVLTFAMNCPVVWSVWSDPKCYKSFSQGTCSPPKIPFSLVLRIFRCDRPHSAQSSHLLSDGIASLTPETLTIIIITIITTIITSIITTTSITITSTIFVIIERLPASSSRKSSRYAGRDSGEHQRTAYSEV